MKEFFLLVLFMTSGILFPLWIDIDELNQLKKTKFGQWLYNMSFQSIVKKLQKINVNYTVTEYTISCVLVGGVLFAIVYNTIHSWSYTMILVGLSLFFLPYLNYINCMRKYEEKTEREAYDYTITAITYLRENRSAFRVLRDCQRLVDQPLQDDLEKVLVRIHNGDDMKEVLHEFFCKYPYDEILKLNQLLLSKAKEGIYSTQQYNVLVTHLENLEKVVNNFRIQKEAKRKGFYMVIGFSLLSGYLVQSLFNADMMMNVSKMNFYYFVFYLVHLVLILVFERKYAKTTKSKERSIKS